MAALSEVRYARRSGVFIAYRIAGDGPFDVVLAPSWMSHIEQNLEWPGYTRLINGLSRFCRLILFDRRGTGLSDALRSDGTFEEASDDIVTVMDAVGSERAAVIGIGEGGPLGVVFAATHPGRVSALALVSSFAKGTASEDYPWAPTPQLHERVLAAYADHYGVRAMGIRDLAPAYVDDPVFTRYVLRAQRYGASPGAAMAWYRVVMEIDVREILPSLRVPTLVLHRGRERYRPIEGARYLASAIPGARLRELAGEEHFVMVGDVDAVVGELEEFLTGSRTEVSGERQLATVLFTDIVGSTELASRMGDRRWRDLLDAQRDLVRERLTMHSGREANTSGDGFLAAFDGPARGIRCAADIRDAVGSLGIEVRAGLHAGEVELMGDDLGGIAVHIGARVCGLAGPSEVLVSRTVKDLVAGSGIAFEAAGEHELRGVPDSWELHRVVAV